MKERVFEFLNTYYRIDDNDKILFDVEHEKRVYILDILEHLELIYDLGEETNQKLFKEWVNNLLSDEEYEENLKFKFNNNRYAPIYEPKRKNRYLITFPEKFHIQQYVIQKAERPRMKVIRKKILGFEISKKVVWDDIVIKFIDPIGPSTSQALMGLVYPDKNKHRIIDEEFNFNIEMIDPTGTVVERWLLENCKIKSIDFGDLSYSSDEVATCTMTIKIGDAILLF